MGKKLTIFKSRIQRKRSIPSDRAWNSEQKSILQQVSYSNTRRNTAILSSKYCQFDYNLDKIWRQSYSNWQYSPTIMLKAASSPKKFTSLSGTNWTFSLPEKVQENFTCFLHWYSTISYLFSSKKQYFCNFFNIFQNFESINQ